MVCLCLESLTDRWSDLTPRLSKRLLHMYISFERIPCNCVFFVIGEKSNKEGDLGASPSRDWARTGSRRSACHSCSRATCQTGLTPTGHRSSSSPSTLQPKHQRR